MCVISKPVNRINAPDHQKSDQSDPFQYSVLLHLITMGSGRLDSGFCCLKVALDTSSQIIAIFSLIIGLVGVILG